MIDEIFLQSAVQIRRTYLKVNNNLDFYKNRISVLSTNLDNIIDKITKLQENIESSDNKITTENAIEQLITILKEVDDEGKSLENLIEPLNKEIEKLATEEVELYRKIKEKHHDLTDDQIVESVKNRLISEKLN